MTSRRRLPPLDDDEDDSSNLCLYELLGLSRSSTPLEVKAAFRVAARRLHPDRLQGGSSSEKRGKTAAAAGGGETPSSSSPSGAAFAAAREAFLVLSDPVRRAAYDSLGTGGGGGGWYRSRGGGRGGGGGGGERGAFWPAEAFAAAAMKDPKASAFPSPSSPASASAAAAAAVDAASAAARKRAPNEASAALLAGLGHLRCVGVDPRCQLVLTCGLCSRPAGVSCSVCLLPLCALCCRRRHARAPGDSVGGRPAGDAGSSGSERGSSSSSSNSSSSSLAFRPHWPLVDAPGSMSRRLAARELETKRLADAALADSVAPHARGRQELEDVRGLRERYLGGDGGRAEGKGRGGGAAAAAASAFEDGGGDAGGRGCSSSRTTYEPFLSRFYAWDQTHGHVVVAVRLPTGDADRGLRVEVAETAASGDDDERVFASSSSSSSSSSRPTHRLLVAADGAPPVIDRVFARAVARGGSSSSSSSAPPALVRRSADKRALLLTVAKAVPGELWPCLFLGDSMRARCVDPPYAVREGSGSGSGRSRRSENADDDANDENSTPSAADDGAIVEVELCPRLLPLPAWVEKRHISVKTTAEKLSVHVEGLFELERYFWDSTGRAVLPSETTWCLEKKTEKKKSTEESEGRGKKGPEEEEAKGSGDAKMRPPPPPPPTKTTTSSTLLTITLVRPSSSPSNDNRMSPRPDSRPPGRRFFACDDDFYGLEDSVAAGVLAALSSALDGDGSSSPSPPSPSSSSAAQVGAAVRAPPWRHAAAAADEGRPRRVREAACLPPGARRQLEAILEEEEEEEEGDEEGDEGRGSSDDSDDSDDGF